MQDFLSVGFIVASLGEWTVNEAWLRVCVFGCLQKGDRISCGSVEVVAKGRWLNGSLKKVLGCSMEV